jgi:Concanavalin A-like lectin/glucanases superfamily
MSVYSDAVLSLNPTSYWRFTGASPLADSGSAGITLTAIDSPTRVPSIIPGEESAANGAYDLNGTSQYLHAGNVYDFSAGVDWTVLMWIKPESDDFGAPTFRRMFEKRNTSAPNAGYTCYGVGASPSVQQRFDIDTGAAEDGRNTSEVPNISTDSVHLAGITYVHSTTTLSFYVDGSFLGQWDDPLAFPASTADFAIGSTSGSDRWFLGVIDDVAVWQGTALNDSQMSVLWDAGNATAESGGLAWLRRRSRATSW